jgi:hypothetical protein
MDGYEFYLSFQFVRYCELNKIILLRLPPHLTYFLQPLDVVIFQQWKYWYTEAIDYTVRYGVGEFDRQAFLASIELIRNAIFSVQNIKSAFRRCGFISFRPVSVLRQIQVNETIFLDDERRPDETISDNNSLLTIWSSPTTHGKLQQRGKAIQNILRSSAEPPDTPTRVQNRVNV